MSSYAGPECKALAMKTFARFIAILPVSLVLTMIAWDALATGKLYYCTDEVGAGFLTPGNWVHGELAVVPEIDANVSMSDPDQILAGWTVGRLWVLWGGLLASCAGVSLVGALLFPSRCSRASAR